MGKLIQTGETLKTSLTLLQQPKQQHSPLDAKREKQKIPTSHNESKHTAIFSYKNYSNANLGIYFWHINDLCEKCVLFL